MLGRVQHGPRILLLAAVLAVVPGACDDDPERAAPDARAPAEPPPARRTPTPEPVKRDPPRPREIPLDTPSDLRSALRGATGSMRALWTLVDPARGLSTYIADDGTARDFCRLEEAPRPSDFPYMLDSGDRFTCNDALSRCTSADATDRSGYSFHFRPGTGPRRLDAVVRYSNRSVPDEDPATVAAFVATSGSVCLLRAAVAAAKEHRPADADMPDELWKYRHPLQGADEDTPEGAPEERQLCGFAARQAAGALMAELGALGRPVACTHDPLSCTYSSPMAERRLFARLDASGRPLPWVVAELASLPSETDAARQARDLAAFLRRAGSEHCP